MFYVVVSPGPSPGLVGDLTGLSMSSYSQLFFLYKRLSTVSRGEGTKGPRPEETGASAQGPLSAVRPSALPSPSSELCPLSAIAKQGHSLEV